MDYRWDLDSGRVGWYQGPIDQALAPRDTGSLYARPRIGSSSKGTRRRESKDSQIHYAPDPPAWSSPPAGNSSHQWKEERYMFPPKKAYYDEYYYASDSKKSARSPRRLTFRPDASTAEDEYGLFTAPSTPQIGRLQTPDIDPPTGEFCDCKSCLRKSQYADQKAKVDSQRHAAMQHIRASTKGLESAGSRTSSSSKTR